MPVAQVSAAELFNACRTIFGPQVNISLEFLRYLQPIGVKSAFKKRALETHPDRVKQLGGASRNLDEEFRNVKQAYELLLSYVENKASRIAGEPAFTARRTRQPYEQSRYRRKTGYGPSQYRSQQSRQRNPFIDHFYRGTVPRRNLMLGQFLYYSGAISWRMLIDAISWQRSLRPAIGQIALQSGILKHNDVVRILTERRLNEKFGECAVRIGCLTPVQQTTLVSRQTRQQHRIGEYFVQQGVLSEQDLALHLSRQRLHNSSTAPEPGRAQRQ